MSDTDCGRLISVLVFYVFSCSYLHGNRSSKPSREARNESQLLWREEIESGPIPSFTRNNTSRQSSPGFGGKHHKKQTPSFSSSSKSTSSFSPSLTAPLRDLVDEKRKLSVTTTTVVVEECPDVQLFRTEEQRQLHLVVSPIPESRAADIAWMTLPPPPARIMRDINRAAHIRKTGQSPRLELDTTEKDGLEYSYRVSGEEKKSYPSPSTPELIRRPPPALQKPFSPVSVEEFEDIYVAPYSPAALL